MARVFYTFGPRMYPNDGRVVGNFIIQALNHDPITVYGDGRQTRSFCYGYVDDLIEGLVKFMETDDGVTGPINLGNPEEFSVQDLAKKIIHLKGSKSDIRVEPLPSDDPTMRQPDITKARTILGLLPKVSFDEGLTQTICLLSRHAPPVS